MGSGFDGASISKTAHWVESEFHPDGVQHRAEKWQFLAWEPMDNLWPMMTGSPETHHPQKKVSKTSAVKDFLRTLQEFLLDLIWTDSRAFGWMQHIQGGQICM